MSPRELIRIDEHVVIDRPVEDVWAFIIDPANDLRWMGNLLDFEADWEIRPQVGDHTRRVAKVAGRRCEFTAEITEVVPAKAFAWKSLQAPFPFANGLRLEATGRATRLTFWGETAGMRGFFGKLADPVVARMFARDMRSNLQTLKALLEQKAQPSASLRGEKR